MKKLLSLFLIASMLLVSAAGCKGGESSQTSSLPDSSVSSSSAESSLPPESSENPSSQESSEVSSEPSSEASSEISSEASSATSGETSSQTSSTTTSPASSAESTVTSSKPPVTSSQKSSAASSQTTSSGPVERTYSKSVPRKQSTARGNEVYGDSYNVFDASNKAQGYLLVKSSDPQGNDLVLRVAKSGGKYYDYFIPKNKEVTIPLAYGSGSYTLTLLTYAFTDENGNRMYGTLTSCSISVSLSSEYAPFLYDNMITNNTGTATAANLAANLTKNVANDLEAVQVIFDYVVDSLSYDKALAANPPSGYVPDLDKVINKGKGICYDYAALATTMLRSQNIPCKLVMGYAEAAYHAWISVHVDDHGWITRSINIVEFKGQIWVMMDPTFVSTGGDKGAVQYIGNGSKYTDANYH